MVSECVNCDDLAREVEELRARLTAVEAVCEEGISHPGRVAPSAETRFWLADIRAAARGEVKA